jgi:hypothetical protein
VGDEAQAIRHLEAELGPRSEKAWREELNAARRSLFDRGLLDDGSYEALARAVAAGRRAELMPGPHRPKNAYNLLRLLHSCRRWLETGEPLIEVTGDLREVLLDIKAQRIPIERTLELARDASAAVEAAAEDARLPEAPDHAAADGLLRACRRAAASATFHVGEPPEAPPAPAPGAPFARRPLPARSRPTSTSTSSAASSSPTSTPARRWSPWPCPAPTPTASRPPTRTST